MIASFLQAFGNYMEAGGWVMPPLLFSTIVLWFAIGYRFAALRRGTKRGARNLIRRIEQGKQRNRDGVLVKAARKALHLSATEADDLRPYLDDAFAESERDIGKYRVLITTIVLSAPLLGLLGTVIGMIETFDSLGDMSLFSQSGGIAGGISQALFTTQMGLAVAIPGLIVSGMLDRRQKDIEMELAQIKDILSARRTEQTGAM